MAIHPKFFGKIQNRQFVHDDPELFGNFLAKFDKGKEMEMTMRPRYRRRTQGAPGEATNFNGYYWAVVVRIISDTMGEIDDNETHMLLQMLFNKKGVTVADPETKQRRNYEIPRGTKDLNGGEFAEYCSKIRMWASMPGNLAEKGVYIPEPNEAEY